MNTPLINCLIILTKCCYFFLLQSLINYYYLFSVHLTDINKLEKIVN